MTKKEITQEFRKIDYELRVDRPKIVPYPPDLIKRREFLILAQVHLNNILDTKFKKDILFERLETELYSKVIEIYHNWD
ncbi:MAG: hypothetical protein H8E13_10200 [Actinobacteria bacterium]|nr:hypothetical protein [Actinomycetota bacterium]